MARTLLDKLWDSHVVLQEPDCPAVLSIDLHLIHEVTSPQAFTELAKRGLSVRRPDRTIATMDHSTPTLPGGLATADDEAKAQLKTLEDNCEESNIELHALGTPKQGIVHVMGPELGLTQPGMTVVCGDSHTSTHGAFGALAFGIGTSEVGHVLATQCMLLRKPKSFLVKFEGSAGTGVTAKDLILGLIAKIGVGGGTGHVFEYAGEAIRNLDMEGRMTVCNMSIEAGARAGMIAPDETTFAWIKGREKAPKGAAWDEAVERWKRLPSDEGAVYDREITIDVASLEPMITFGTNPGMGIGITSPIPSPESLDTQDKRDGLNKALAYMGLNAGDAIIGHPIDVVFIGSCTNSRLPDLHAAATIFRGRKVKEGVRVLIVPGSMEVKRLAEEVGLDKVFTDAGAEWREPGCSMCIAMNGDMVGPGQVAVSTSNRNFEGRQGKGSRTLLASPLTAAASAVTGVVTDPRTLI